MAEISEARAAIQEPAVVEATGPAGRTSKQVLDFIYGAQSVALEEAVFATQEWFDRARTETHLLSEFASKMAAAHSVNNITTMIRECGQHQIDFLRRDCDRVFTHSRRMVDAISALFGRPSVN